MLFTSPQFVLLLLPLAFAGFALFASRGWNDTAKLWVIVASLVFYSWWKPENLPLLLLSIGVNFLIGRRLVEQPSRGLLALGIVLNCLFLGYFKYTMFALTTLDSLFGTGWSAPRILLPLGISFWTFQQIGFLIDANAGSSVRAHSITPMHPEWKSRYGGNGYPEVLEQRIKETLPNANAQYLAQPMEPSRASFYDAMHLKWDATPAYTAALLSSVERSGGLSSRLTQDAEGPTQTGPVDTP